MESALIASEMHACRNGFEHAAHSAAQTSLCTDLAEAEALQQRAERRQSEPAAAVAAYEAAVVRHWLSTWRNAQIADVLMTSIASNTENRALWLTARHQIKPFSLLWAGKVRAGCPSI